MLPPPSGLSEGVNMLCVDTVETPIGPIHLALRGGALHALRFDQPFEGTRAPAAVSERLRAHFAGDVHALDELGVDPYGTPLQQRGWAASRAIPPGEPATYAARPLQLGTHPRA